MMKRINFVLLAVFGLPLFGYNQFIENKGQVVDHNQNFHPEVKYYSSSGNASVYFLKDKVVYNFREDEKIDFSNTPYKNNAKLQDSIKGTLGATHHRIDLDFVGSGFDAQIRPEDKTGYSTNFMLNKRANISGVSSFEKLTYPNVYPNIDLVFYNSEKGIKYDFIIYEGGDITDIKLRYNGAKKITLTESGELKIETNFGELIETIPVSFLNGDNNKVVEVNYDVGKDGVISFLSKAKNYEKLTIDPFLTWSTYFEGPIGDGTLDRYASVADDQGNLFLEGYINNAANDYPVVDPGGSAYSQNYVSNNLYIAKFDVNRSLVWATYYGGSTDLDWALGTEPFVLAGNTLHLVGNQLSSDAPLVNGGGYYNGAPNSDPYWLRLDKNTGELLHATSFPGHTSSYPSIAVSNSGLVAIIQHAYDFSAPVIINRAGAYNQATNGGYVDMHIMLLNSSYNAIWGTFLGGPNTTDNFHVTFDSNDEIFFVGEANNTFGPTASNTMLVNLSGSYYQGTYSAAMGNHDLIIGKFNSSGALIWHTLYGGDSSDGLKSQMGNGSRVIIDPSNDDLIVIGGTNSSNFPVQTMAGAFNQTTPPANTDPNSGSYWDFNSFIIKFNNNGVRDWATYWGDDIGGDLLYDGKFVGCNKFIVGSRSTDHTTIPLSYGYNQSTGNQTFLMQFDGNYAAEWSSYIGQGGVPSLAFSNLDNRLYVGASTYNTAISMVDPGGGAYFDATNDDPSVTTSSPAFSIFELNLNPQITGSNSVCTGATITLTGGGTPAASNPWVSSNTSVATVDNSGVVTGQSSGTATITFTDNAGCSSNYNITVSASSTAPTGISGTSSICSGGSTTLTLVGGSAGLGATAQWYSGTCGGTSVGSGNSITVSPTSNTTYFVRYEGTCNTTTCASQTVTINSNSTAPTGITGTTTICSGSSTTLTLSGGSAGTGSTAQWYSGTCGGTSVGSGNSITVSPTSNTTYFVRYEGTCNTTACASQLVTVNPLPNVPTASVSPSAICEGGSATLSSSGCSGTIEWYTNSGGTGTPLASTTVSPTGTTTYYAFCTENGCRSATGGSVSLTVNSNPTVTVPSGGNVCEGATLNLTPSTGGTWSSSDPSVATITNGGVVTGVNQGTADMTYTETSTGCSSTASTGTITVNPLPTFTVSLTDPSSCGATDGMITISGLNSSTSYEVSIASGALNPENSDGSGEIILTGLGSGSYSPIEVSLNNCSTIDNGTYDLNDPSSPAITVPNGGELCEGEILNLTPSSGGTWTSNDPSVATIDNTGLLTGIAAGSTTVTYTETATGCSSTASAGSITVNPIPTVTVPSGGNVCEGATLNLTPSTGGTWSSSDPSVATITNAGEVTGISVGTADMTFTNTTTGCSSVTSTGTITVNASPTITVPAGNEICVGSTLNLEPTTGGTWTSNDPTVATITGGGVVTGVSQGTTEMVFTSTTTGCSSIASDGTVIVNATPTLTIGAINCNKPTSSYSVDYTTNAGATVTASVGSVTSTAVTGVPNDQQVVITATSSGCPSVNQTVSTDECDDVVVDVSNGVSPNSDGMNDFLEITNLDAYPEHNLSIYNRWGDKVFQSSPYENDWNGQNNVGGIGGEELPAGTYFYILELGENEDPIKGYIELKR